MNPVAHGAALMAHGQFEAAAEVLAAVIDRSQEAAGLLGGIRQGQGRTAEAEALYRQALAMDPNYILARDGLDGLGKGVFFPWGKGLFWPTRQIFMSAAVYLKREIGRPLDMLEVGSYVGGSALTWSHAVGRFLPEGARLHCIDIWHGRSEPFPGEATFGFFSSGLMYNAFLGNIATAPPAMQITHQMGWSNVILPTLKPDSFDIVYLDGSHYYRDALVDIDNGRPLVRDGGFLCGDDLELQLAECDAANALRHRESDFIPDPRTGQSFHVGVTLAVSERFGPVSNYDGFWILQRVGTRFERVDLRPASALYPAHWPASQIDPLRQRFSQSGELASVRD